MQCNLQQESPTPAQTGACPAKDVPKNISEDSTTSLLSQVHAGCTASKADDVGDHASLQEVCCQGHEHPCCICRRMQGVRPAKFTRPPSGEVRRSLHASWPHSALKEAMAASHDMQQMATADQQTINQIAVAAAANSMYDGNEHEVPPSAPSMAHTESANNSTACLRSERCCVYRCLYRGTMEFWLRAGDQQICCWILRVVIAEVRMTRSDCTCTIEGRSDMQCGCCLSILPAALSTHCHKSQYGRCAIIFRATACSHSQDYGAGNRWRSGSATHEAGFHICICPRCTVISKMPACCALTLRLHLETATFHAPQCSCLLCRDRGSKLGKLRHGDAGACVPGALMRLSARASLCKDACPRMMRWVRRTWCVWIVHEFMNYMMLLYHIMLCYGLMHTHTVRNASIRRDGQGHKPPSAVGVWPLVACCND